VVLACHNVAQTGQIRADFVNIYACILINMKLNRVRACVSACVCVPGWASEDLSQQSYLDLESANCNPYFICNYLVAIWEHFIITDTLAGQVCHDD